MARWGDRIEIIPAAVWSGAYPAPALVPDDDPDDTCQFSMIRPGEGQRVPTTTLDDVLARAVGGIRLLKLDCEGSEYAILDGADLSAVEEITGESHDVVWQDREWNMDDIVRLLGPRWSMTRFKNGPATDLFTGRQTAS
jgi:hypothetical protein